MMMMVIMYAKFLQKILLY